MFAGNNNVTSTTSPRPTATTWTTSPAWCTPTASVVKELSTTTTGRPFGSFEPDSKGYKTEVGKGSDE